jgi:hypothetical protein
VGDKVGRGGIVCVAAGEGIEVSVGGIRVCVVGLQPTNQDRKRKNERILEAGLMI